MDKMILILATRLAAEYWVEEHRLHFKHVAEPFDWDKHLTDFQREQFLGQAKLHLEAMGDILADARRLDWLEETANGEPIEVDSFTCVKDAPAVFLTTYPATGESMCNVMGCRNERIAQITSHRLSQGTSLREAIDRAMEK